MIGTAEIQRFVYNDRPEMVNRDAGFDGSRHRIVMVAVTDVIGNQPLVNGRGIDAQF